MIKNQFTYSRTEGDKTFIDSFNVNNVIRTISFEKGDMKGLAIVLNDFHEEVRQVEVPIAKTNKTRIEHRKMEVCSEVYLGEEDAVRYRKLLSIED